MPASVSSSDLSAHHMAPSADSSSTHEEFFVSSSPKTLSTVPSAEAHFRHFLIELSRQYVDIVLVRLGFLPISQHNKLRQLWPHCQRQHCRRKLTAHGMTVLLRRTPTQTASRHSASLPVHKMMFCGLLMTLSATSQGDFSHKVDHRQTRSEMPSCGINWVTSTISACAPVARSAPLPQCSP